MAERLSEAKVNEIQERHKAALPGPYRWYANVKVRDIYLSTIDRGRIFVMQFGRWGTQEAAPIFQDHKAGRMERFDKNPKFATEPDHNGAVRITHPDAVALEHSWQDVEDLLNERAALLAEVAGLKERAATADTPREAV